MAHTEAKKKVCDILPSLRFWHDKEDCIRTSKPLLIVLRIVDGNEKPTMPKVTTSIDHAMNKIIESFGRKPRVLKKVMDIIDRWWVHQMEQKLHGVAQLLNPNKYFDLKEKILTMI